MEPSDVAATALKALEPTSANASTAAVAFSLLLFFSLLFPLEFLPALVFIELLLLLLLQLLRSASIESLPAAASHQLLLPTAPARAEPQQGELVHHACNHASGWSVSAGNYVASAGCLSVLHGGAQVRGLKTDHQEIHSTACPPIPLHRTVHRSSQEGVETFVWMSSRILLYRRCSPLLELATRETCITPFQLPIPPPPPHAHASPHLHPPSPITPTSPAPPKHHPIHLFPIPPRHPSPPTTGVSVPGFVSLEQTGIKSQKFTFRLWSLLRECIR